MCICIWRELFQGIGSWDCRSLEVQNLQGVLAGQDSGKSCGSSANTVCWQDSFLLREGHSIILSFIFSLFRPSTDWMKPISVTEGNPLYSKSMDLNVNLIQKKTFTETSRIMFCQISGHHSPAKLIHKINHHSHIVKKAKKHQRPRHLHPDFLGAGCTGSFHLLLIPATSPAPAGGLGGRRYLTEIWIRD